MKVEAVAPEQEVKSMEEAPVLREERDRSQKVHRPCPAAHRTTALDAKRSFRMCGRTVRYGWIVLKNVIQQAA